MTPSILPPRGFLATVEQALHMLGSVSTLNEVIDFRNQAEALRVLAQRSRCGLAAQNACAEIRIRAELKIGLLLDTMDRQRVGRPQLVARGDYYGVPRLRDLGITKSISYRARRLVEIPTELFETYIADIVESQDELTSRGLLLYAERRTHSERTQRRIRGGAVADLVAFAAAGHRVGTLLVDPPWPVEGASALLPYRATTIEDLKALPVAGFCAERCHCHIWCLPNPTLFRAEEILIEWGFRPVAVLTWLKTAHSAEEATGVTRPSISSRAYAATLIDLMTRGYQVGSKHHAAGILKSPMKSTRCLNARLRGLDSNSTREPGDPDGLVWVTRSTETPCPW